MNLPALPVRRIDPDLPLPAYHSAGAAGLDLAARVAVVIEPGRAAKVPLNVAVRLPEGHWGLLAARSSLHKKCLTLANGIGVGDPDFCGDGDEYQAVLLNFGDVPVAVERGERIAQLVVVPFTRVAVQEAEALEAPDRGGFGTTGSA